MIKYNLNNINDWNFGEDNIIKVYRNNAVCYYKVTSGDTPTPVQEPCFAVVDNISQYSETEFEDVFNLADDKWYKLNNLNQYEQYGIYGEGRNITYYEGKLTVDDGYEYMYSGGSWVNIGEVTGSTASLPDVPFTVNYNAKNYNSSTKTLLKTSGQLADVDAVITAGTPTVHDGYLTIATNTRATISGYQTYFNRTISTPNLTIISKQRTNNNSDVHLFANRDSNYNWMYRATASQLKFHGSSQINGTNVTTQPVIESVRVDSSRTLKFNNYTDNTTTSVSSFSYGSTNSTATALFAGYANNTSEWFSGDFYWVYMCQSTLTDDQVQQVIAYNEGGGGQTEYPLEYVVREDPPDNLVFSSMEEAEAYECPWVGMKAKIDGDNYVFSGDSTSGYEWICNPSRLPQGYTEVEYIQNTGTSYLNIAFTPNQDTRVVCDMQNVTASNYPRLWGAGAWNSANGLMIDYDTNQFQVSWLGNTSWTNYSAYPTSVSYNRHTYDLNKNYMYIDEVLVGSNTYATRTASDPIGIFTHIGSGRPSSSSYWGQEHLKGKMYSFKVYDNGTLVRDLVPCVRDNDNEVGAYDIVNDVFYTVPTGYTTDKLVAGSPV